MSAVVGVLALQGAFAAHRESLEAFGVRTCEVRTPSDLGSIDALVMPGGESSTMSQLLESSGLFDAIASSLDQGMSVFGTCAGMILLGSQVVDGRADQRCFGAIDIAVRRNAYGRQVDSFEADLDTSLGPVRGVFIRAPRIERTGPAVEVLARWNGEPVLVRQERVLAASFHPELSGDGRVHEYFLGMALKGMV